MKIERHLNLEANQTTTLEDLPNLPAKSRIHLRLTIDHALWRFTSPDLDVYLALKATDQPQRVLRLYGPARRVPYVDTVVPLPEAGAPLLDITNPSYLYPKSCSLSLTLLEDQQDVGEQADDESADHGESSTEAAAPRGPVESSPPPSSEVTIDAGHQREFSLRAHGGATLSFSFDVLEGGSVDFAIMLVPEGKGGPVRLYGPARRMASLTLTQLQVPESGTCYVAFDASSAWWYSRRVRYALQVDDLGAL